MQSDHSFSHQDYRHTQPGYVTIIALIIFLLILIPIQYAVGEWTWISLIFLVPLLGLILFASLTVKIDAHKLGFHFGIGLIHKRISLSEIRHFRTVTNPWYYGWGIHGYPGGILYNVSGNQAVEILLHSGKRLRVGTDQPRELCQALQDRLGQPSPLTSQEIDLGSRTAKRSLLIGLGITAGIVFMIGLGIFLESRPPRVTLNTALFRVESFLYSVEFPIEQITDVALRNCIPKVLARTNGYGGLSELRGHFKLDVLGHGQLYINTKSPPFVVVKNGPEFVIVNYAEPTETQKLYAKN